MNKTILTDVDGVILDFLGAFEQWVIQQGYDINENAIGHDFDLSLAFKDDVDAIQVIRDFFNTDMASNLMPLRESNIHLGELNDNGYDFIAITACPNLDDVLENRKNNIKNAIGFDFKQIIGAGFLSGKKDILSRYSPSVWVEDNLDHAIIGAELGHQVFLIDHPYNQGKGQFTRVNCWEEIKYTILNNDEK